MTSLPQFQEWVDAVAALTHPDQVIWCDGSQAEYDRLMAEMLVTGDMLELNQATHPGLLPASFRPGRCGRVEHLYLHLYARTGRRRPEQPLDAPR